MPKKQEEALIKAGKEKGLSGKALDKFVYGTMVNRGWSPTGKKKGPPYGNKNATKK
jgi:hypothetical protein